MVKNEQKVRKKRENDAQNEASLRLYPRVRDNVAQTASLLP